METDKKIVVVSGASSGVGLAIAARLGELGHSVFAGARQADDIHRLSSLRAVASNAFRNQRGEFEAYKVGSQSEFTTRAVQFLEAVFTDPARKEKEPQMVVDAVLHAIFNTNNRLYYQPGRRLVPDLLAARLPRRLVDLLLSRF